MAWAAPDARMAPPAPALMAGMDGMEPTVMRTALRTLMALGCSLVRKSRAFTALRSHTGALVTVETVAG